MPWNLETSTNAPGNSRKLGTYSQANELYRADHKAHDSNPGKNSNKPHRVPIEFESHGFGE